MSAAKDLEWLQREQQEAADYFRNSLNDPVKFPDRRGAERGIEDTLMEEAILLSQPESKYRQFLESKVVTAREHGFTGSVEFSADLKPHAQDIARWMIRGGNRACFASFGLHKTSIQLQVCESLLDHGCRSALIVCPLGVRREFLKETKARGFKRTPVYVATNEEHEALQSEGQQLFLTNYERVRDGDLDPNRFEVASLDEAAVLRSYGSKTFQTFLPLFDQVRHKFVATATPSPNRLKELIHYAGFLGIMDTGQCLTRFFKRDSTQAGNLTLHPHKEREFWLWVSTWATFLQRPSDLGYSDDGYILPPLNIHRHRLPVDHTTAGYDSWGQGKLLREATSSLSAAARERRDSLKSRINKLREIINGIGSSSLSKAIPREEQGTSSREEENLRSQALPRKSGEVQRKKQEVARRESEEIQGPDQAIPVGESGQGDCHEQGLVPKPQSSGECYESYQKVEDVRVDPGGLSEDSRSATWDVPDMPPADGSTCSRSQSSNRHGTRASVPAMQCGTGHLQGRSTDHSASAGLPQFIVWCELNVEQRAIEALLRDMGISCSSLYGSMAIEDREQEMEKWLNCETVALVTKPIMYGYGANLQQCHISIFLGISYKFSDLIQATFRTWRFGQTHPVDVHLIYTESEDPIYEALLRKWKQHDELQETMTGLIREFGLNNAKAASDMRRSIHATRQEVKGQTFTAVLNDNVEEMPRLPDNSVDLIVTSWPFSNHYEYTETYNDFGHNEDDARFFEQMDFLTPNLKRALKPGRMYCLHCKDRILYGSVTGLGMYSVNPFSDKCVAHLQKHGFIYCGRITIVTDVVRENNQTYRLGWTEKCKDGTKMGVGSPEYILLFRKLPTDLSRAYADSPVMKSKQAYTRSRWQFDASPFWRSSGDRFLSPDEIRKLPQEVLRQAWHAYNREHVYSFEQHVGIAESLESQGLLPASFMLLDPVSHSPWVWDDVARMRTLNTEQSRRRLEMHVCPLQLDVVERLIETYSGPGELILDPFAGIFTVPHVAIKLGRRGYGIELSEDYWHDGVAYCRAAEAKYTMPSLFDVLETENAKPEPTLPME